MTDWFSDLNDRVSKGLLMPADAQPTPEIQNVGNEAVISDIPWAVNYLLEQIAAKFEAWDTFDLFRSEAAATVRSFKHDLAAQPPAAPGENKKGDQVHWLKVNDEPFEYAIQQGPHGDEFVKLLNGECLRRPLQSCSAGSESPFKEIEPPFNVYHQLTEIGDKNGHVCTAENGEIAKDILAALNIAARSFAEPQGAGK